MKRLLNILVFLCLPLIVFPQEETHVVDSLLGVLPSQEGREKVETMIELTWEFYEISYDDCLDWGEKAIKEAQTLGMSDLEARANYVLGLQYAYHGDLDLAKFYLRESYVKYLALSDTENAFESLWDIATYELLLGNIDTAFSVYQTALDVAEDDYYSGRASILSNLGFIEHKKGDLEEAYAYYEQAKSIFEFIKDERMTILMDKEMACISSDKGRSDIARKVFWKIIPKLENYEDNCSLCEVSQRLGRLYANEYINYDSALYYLQKSIDFSLMPMQNQEDVIDANNLRAETLLEIANLMMRQGDHQQALEYYHEALDLAKDRKHQYGEMMAYVGLITYYAQLGQAPQSLRYYSLYSELEKSTGIVSARPLLKKSLVMDYALLGRFEEMTIELEALDEQNKGLERENNDLYDRLTALQEDFSCLLSQYESQNEQIKTLQAQRDHYRLAFFGLLAIALFALAMWIAYRIVRKKTSK